MAPVALVGWGRMCREGNGEDAARAGPWSWELAGSSLVPLGHLVPVAEGCLPYAWRLRMGHPCCPLTLCTGAVPEQHPEGGGVRGQGQVKRGAVPAFRVSAGSTWPQEDSRCWS